MIEIVCATFIIFIIFAIWNWGQNKAGHPLPRPKGFPIVGVLPNLDYSKMPQQLTKLGKDFKGIFHMGFNIVVVDDQDIATEIMVRQDPTFANRDDGNIYLPRAAMGDDIAFGNYTEKLQMMRKAAVKALNLRGSGLQKLEKIVHEEVGAFLDDIHDKAGSDIDPTHLTYAAVINTMTSLLLGEKFSYSSEEVRSVEKLDHRFMDLGQPMAAPEINRFPWMLHLPFARYKKKKEELKEFVDLRESVMESFVDKYKKFYDPKNIHCVLSSLLETQETMGTDVFTDEMVGSVMLDLIIAGSMTTSNTIAGMFFILAHKPEVQERIYHEIQEVIGDGRLPRAEDKESLPYVSAFILECLRYHTIVPLNIPRVSACNTKIGNYDVPKNTMVMVNQWAIHHKAEEWEKPHEFYPEHFLDDQGHLLPAHVYKKRGYLPFGAGRRVCPGENLAKNRLFLIVSATVQRFRISSPQNERLPEMTPDNYVHCTLMQAPKYKVQFAVRD